MLRISHSESPDGPHLRLEGRLVGEWVLVLAKELEALGRYPALVLDLASVEFVNEAGVRVLLDARARGARFEACSPLLTSLLGDDPR
ncbi:MAG TPA: hypothetical protein VFQ35_00890 [Polyangiaceae bacterium]|nr:hypothetical protein [Polyangiaceae bacterium]